MTPEQLRDIAAQIMRHKSTVAVEGVVPQWLHDQLHAHAAALEKLKVAEEALMAAKREHDMCDDPWYSCPASSEGCANEFAGAECNCGADRHNAAIAAALAAIREKP